jgi:hypothetical protein
MIIEVPVPPESGLKDVIAAFWVKVKAFVCGLFPAGVVTFT